jgi:hypothetical protein
MEVNMQNLHHECNRSQKICNGIFLLINHPLDWSGFVDQGRRMICKNLSFGVMGNQKPVLLKKKKEHLSQKIFGPNTHHYETSLYFVTAWCNGYGSIKLMIVYTE